MTLTDQNAWRAAIIDDRGGVNDPLGFQALEAAIPRAFTDVTRRSERAGPQVEADDAQALPPKAGDEPSDEAGRSRSRAHQLGRGVAHGTLLGARRSQVTLSARAPRRRLTPEPN